MTSGSDNAPHLRFVYLSADGRSTSSGQAGDEARARRHRRGEERLLWFVKDGREFVVRDAAVLDEVERTWQRVGPLGDSQKDAGRVLFSAGADVGSNAANQGAVAARLAAAAIREAAARSDDARAQAAKDRETLQAEMARLKGEMDAVTSGLGADLGAAGARLRDAAESAAAEMVQLIERAVASGAAEAVS